MWLLSTSLLLTAVLSSPPCEEAVQQPSEGEALKALARIYDVSDSCYTALLGKNWWQAADAALTRAFEMGYSLPTAKEETRKLKEVLGSFLDILEAGYKVIPPAFEWAESPERVFLNIKFSHRIDSPGCLTISEPKVQLGDDYMLLTAFCKDPDFKYKAMLSLDLADKVNAAESRFSLGSSGYIVVSLEKREQPKAWGALLKGKKPINMHTWWEMKEIYEPDMEKIKPKVDN
jgi:hypothetical protein